MHLFTPTAILVLGTCCGVYSFGFLEPSYVSDWRYIKSQGGAESEIVFVHGLNVLPYKVITEVLVNDNGRHYTFHAMGSALGDDDSNFIHGGIIYLYDDNNVWVLAPSKRIPRHGYRTGIAIYTGARTSWNGPTYISNSFTEAMVRVKVFIPCDFPTPDFQSTWTTISIHDAVTYQEVAHNLDGYPDFVVLQVKNKNNTVSEGLGSTSILKAVNQYHHVGGVVYGFSNEFVRIWYPAYTAPEKVCIMCFWDGWGLNQIYNAANGAFRVLAWKTLDRTTTSNNIPHTTTSTGSGEISIDIDISNSFVTVEIEAIDGSNEGFRFYGVGSSTNDGQFGGFGGLIYAYDETKLVYWTPRTEVNGYLINIGGMWGKLSDSNDTINNQTSETGIIRVVVFNFNSEEICCKNETVDESSTEVFISGLKYRDLMNYTCKYGHQVISGNESRICQINGGWDGDAVNCSKIICPENDIVSNGTMFHVTGYDYNDNATYACSSDDKIHIGGDMFRTCLWNGSWSGRNPTCIDIECPSEIINIKGVETNATGFRHRDNVTYKCDEDNPIKITGDFHRTCLTNGTWSGSDPVCQPCMCPCRLLRSNGNNQSGTDAVLKAEIEAIKQRLFVKKDKTSNFVRSKISAPDKRKSAENIGYIGVGFIIVTFLLFVIPDMSRLFRCIKMVYKRVSDRNVSRVYPDKNPHE